jgi:hypothetical protein
VETSTYIFKITFTTSTGELPTDNEVEEMVGDQLEGELDETTGLFLAAVDLIGRIANE